MKGDKIDRRLSAGESAVELREAPESRAHLSLCDGCQSILSRLEAPHPELSDLGLLNSWLSGLFKEDLTPVQPLPSNKFLLGGWILIAVAIESGFTGLVGRRGLQMMTTGQSFFLLLPAICGAVALSVPFLRCISQGAPCRLSATGVFGAMIVGYPSLALLLFTSGESPAATSGC